MGSRKAPNGSLELSWVFGYNGHTAKNNVKANKAGHLVYYVAGVGVVHDIGLRKQKFYTGHNDDITSLALNSDGTMAATGQVGKDAYITVWDTSTCETISVIRDGHTYAVSTLAFSSDGKLLASVGGFEHKQELMIWQWNKGRRLAHSVAFNGKVEEVEWEPGSTSKLVTCGHRHIKFWKFRGNVLQNSSGVFGSESSSDQLSVSHLTNGKVVTGSASGHLHVWVKEKLESTVRDVHPGGVLVTEVYPGGLLTGGRDGTIGVFDKNLNKVSTVPEAPSLVYEIPGAIHSLAVFKEQVIFGTEKNEVWTVTVQHDGGLGAACVVQGHGLGEVWGLATHPTRPIAITASDDQTVRLWDLEDHRPMATSLIDEKARSAAFSPDGQHVAIGLMNGSFIVLQAEQLDELHRVSDRKEVRHDLKYSPDGVYLAVASNDNFVDIYEIESGYERKHTLSGASSFITHLDWSSDSVYIQINTGASERLIYDIYAALVDESDIPDTEWATWTGVLGSAVTGIWQKYSDVNDINTADANFYYNMMVTGDDFGLVKLFRFPCPKRGSKGRCFIGHSAHVTNVRWTSDSHYIVSVGGADHAVFLWKFRPSRRSTPAADRVSVPSAVEDDSDDDGIDTEDELEGIPELTLDLEEEQAGTEGKSRRRRRRKEDPLPKVELVHDSTFAKRRDATDGKRASNKLPIHSLHMKHVFGYRAHECRDNAHWLKDNRIVYFVAAVGIVYNIKSGVQRHYLHHTDDILCLAVHPGGELVASGQLGKNATVHVWDAMDQRIMSLLKDGHKQGIASVCFSGDGEKVASLGLDSYHTVVIWNWRKGYKMASARGHSDKVFGLKFSPSNDNRLITYGIKHIKFWSQTGGGLTYRQVTMGPKLKQDIVLCCGFEGGEGADEKWLFGLSSGTVILVKDLRIDRTTKAHKVPVYALCVTDENIFTAGQDGFVCKWDLEMKKCSKVFPVTDHFLIEEAVVGLRSSQPGIRSMALAAGTDSPLLLGTQHAELLLMNSEGKITILVQGHGKGEVWGLDTHPRLSEAVTVGDDSSLRRWSLDERRPLGCANLRKVARCVHYHPTAIMIAIGCLDGTVILYLYPSLEKYGSAQHRVEGISVVKYSPDGRFLAVGSHESVVDLYVVDTDGDMISKDSSGLRRVGVCRGASSWITHINWHEGSRLLQVNTGAGEQLFYEAPYGTRQVIAEETRVELAWQSPLTCVLDETVEGVWEPGMDLTDINALATAHNLPIVVTGQDDEGLIKLFKYPSKGGFKKHRQYRGHSSHVTNVKWSYDDDLLVTTGGHDTAVIVWQVRKVKTVKDKGGGSPLSPEPDDAMDDLPDEELTMTDLEEAGLDDEDAPKISKNISSRRTKTPKTPLTGTAKGKISGSPPVQRLRSLPTLMPDDKSLYYCSGRSVGHLSVGKGGEVLSQKLGYGEHDADVTSLAVSPGDPTVIATAQLAKEGDVWQDQEPESALIHVWRPSDGTNMAVLRGEGQEEVITALSFSPSGRFLAAMADAATLHVFNWVKSSHIASLELKAGMVTSIAHTGETTVVALTPRTVLFLDLVGNSLVTTRGRSPPDLLPENAAFNGMGVAPNGRVYTGCSDGSMVEWAGRLATRVVAPPEEPRTVPPIRMATVVGQGVAFTACRLGPLVVVRCYTTDDNTLKFFSDSQIASPAEDWTPISARLGGSLLVLGARKSQPFIVLDLRTGKFTLIELG